MGKRRKRPRPQVVILGDDTFDFTLLRLVKCDDGIVRLEVVPDGDAKMRLSEDTRRNVFLTGYVHESLSKHMAEVSELDD